MILVWLQIIKSLTSAPSEAICSQTVYPSPSCQPLNPHCVENSYKLVCFTEKRLNFGSVATESHPQNTF